MTQPPPVPSRRELVRLAAIAIGAAAAPGAAGARSRAGAGDRLAPYRTPFKYGRFVLSPSGVAGSFDEKKVDGPFVFRHDDRFCMTYVGWDGTGYQTGLAESDDLVTWRRRGVILARDPDDPVTRYNIASSGILREADLESPGRLLKVDGRYVCSWNAYPSAGYEEGAAVIGLATSADLIHWSRTRPILRPEDGADWERGGLYKSYLLRHDGLYYLFYNAKTVGSPWHEQIGVATSRDLETWHRRPGNPILRNGVPGQSLDSRFASNPFVLRHGGEWATYYFGIGQDGHARELLALGDTPVSYRKVAEPMIDVGPPGSIDEKHAHKPSVIYHDGALYHFYCGVSGVWPDETRGITVARSRPWR
ncbi:MAG TPA: hypothetical protein VFT56_09335 [Sphingomonas sp.]|nr:hypothetical protein [Sphingomonas sp.]